MGPAKGQHLHVKSTVLCDLFQVGADNLRALYKRTLELDIELKKLLMKKAKFEVEKLEHENKVI